mgnify:CR=1 FL=1
MIPVIDLGVLIDPNAREGATTPSTAASPSCGRDIPRQVCRKLIDPERMHEESLRRNDPERFEEFRRAGYVTTGDDPSPVVVTFTTETATMAVNELPHRLTGFRGDGGHCAEPRPPLRPSQGHRCRPRMPAPVRMPALQPPESTTGRGDMTPFLDQS